MCASREIPNKFGACIPTSIELSSLVTVQIPEHAPVEVRTVGLDSFQYLSWSGEFEGFSDAKTIVNEFCSFTLAIKLHGSILMHLMSQMCSMTNPGKILSIQLQGYRLLQMP